MTWKTVSWSGHAHMNFIRSHIATADTWLEYDTDRLQGDHMFLQEICMNDLQNLNPTHELSVPGSPITSLHLCLLVSSPPLQHLAIMSAQIPAFPSTPAALETVSSLAAPSRWCARTVLSKPKAPRRYPVSWSEERSCGVDRSLNAKVNIELDAIQLIITAVHLKEDLLTAMKTLKNFPPESTWDLRR